jgi:hypothetical protein
MKIFLAAGLLLAAAVTFAQEMMPMAPPKELKRVESWFVGKWTSTSKMSDMGQGMSTMKGNSVGMKVLGGMYIQQNHSMNMGKMGKMSGMYIMTYDPAKKQYIAWWYDSSAPGQMEMSGNFQGDKLIMISKPTPIPGMAEPAIMRATWQKKPGNKIQFVLEMKQGDKWGKMMESDYKKS